MSREPIYDDYGIPLCESHVGNRIWELYNLEQEAFKREVRAYFALGMPGFTPIKISHKQRIIWLRDDRRQRV
ncbi:MULTISPECIES: hypothetical protein [Paenibacillus]|uniref:hypothetical protein n=1 Tax=Paenibacillus TaxID=44249 RepID=UPI001F0972E4|nr:hypothetical protein [Paenibacillus periandrae]